MRPLIERHGAAGRAGPADTRAKHTRREAGADGVTIPAAGVGVLDAVDLSMEEIEVEVLGIPYPLYAELFPSHVRAYDTKFKGDRP